MRARIYLTEPGDMTIGCLIAIMKVNRFRIYFNPDVKHHSGKWIKLYENPLRKITTIRID